ncbi:MAG TPA: beta-phosphoglucomutase [Clostridiales bacterium UBA8960]|nr:beta-phosphoglucomutase [Clostridiales bacterium UBA8960]
MWQLKTNRYDAMQQELEESLFMIGNGYIGVRGSFEEGYASGSSIRGTYINGLYDRVPMVHAEMAYGFPTEQDKQPRVMDTQTCEVWLDGEKAMLSPQQTDSYERYLDFQAGESRRTYIYETRQGKRASIEFKRLASLTETNFLLYKIEVVYDGKIELISICDTSVENYTNPNDPRTGQGHSKLLDQVMLECKEDKVFAAMKTKNSNLTIATIVSHQVQSNADFVLTSNVEDGKATTVIESSGHVFLEKKCCFTDSIRVSDPIGEAKRLIKSSANKFYDDYLADQRVFLDDYWYHTGIDIQSDTEDQMAIRMMQFHLLQSIGVDAFSNIAAKGLSGEGYEGHYFWDTEIYVLPVLMMSQPDKAKELLSFRYHILPQSKARALELGHAKGAAYAWRTISGIECSGYFPAGTAQYHINADIAYAFIQYFLYSQDMPFMVEKGIEVIIETARLWMDIGHYYEGAFRIHNVTGPDEYTAIVNNNYYTNAMAKYHLYWAFNFYQMLNGPEYRDPLLDRLGILDEEANAMRDASDKMFLPFDEAQGLFAQDDSFMSKPVWPFDDVTYSRRPLLLHYHPLTIYRHQVLKQADTVLAHMLLDAYATKDEMKNAFNYYERLTTHDSSLSSCIYGIMASRIGERQKAYDYFKESVFLDLHDTHKNTKDGLHMANMAGTLLSVTAGFGGLRVDKSGLSLRPYKPDAWDSLSFKVKYQGRIIEVTVTERVEVKLLEGESITVSVWDEPVLLESLAPQIKAIIFDLDGVLTETSKAHFKAWQSLAESLGFDVPNHLEDEVRGISRLASLDIVLGYGDQLPQFSHDEKVEMANRKNDIYLDLIKSYSPSDLSHGAIELMEFLKMKGMKIALASASKNAPFLLSAMEIDSYFDAVVDPASIKNGKPAPDIFERAAELLGVSPSESIGIEDAFAGIESIHSAGMNAIGIGSKNHLTNCEIVLSGLDSLKNHLEKHLV